MTDLIRELCQLARDQTTDVIPYTLFFELKAINEIGEIF